MTSCLLLYSFGKLHPALADKHYLRTSDENERIHDARLRMMQQHQQQASQQRPAGRPCTADGGRGRSADFRGTSSSGWAALKQVRTAALSILPWHRAGHRAKRKALCGYASDAEQLETPKPPHSVA